MKLLIGFLVCQFLIGTGFGFLFQKGKNLDSAPHMSKYIGPKF